MDLGLKGKRVLVTGGTKSIGRAIVDTFVSEGAVVGFCARDAKLVTEREKDWQSKQARVSGSALDVADNSALKKWIDGFAGDGASITSSPMSPRAGSRIPRKVGARASRSTWCRR
jgi:NAD(P)-dependent dehydrogenase (short-subunit alcohol dehydrogenase family)